MKVEVFDDALGAAILGDTVVSLWKGPAIIHRQEWLNRQVELALERNPGGILHLMMILPSSDPPDAASRKALQDHLNKLDTKMRKLIAVALGDSLRISLVRTIGRSIIMLAGKSHMLTLVGNVNDAVLEVRKLASPQTPSATELFEGAKALAKALSVNAESIPGYLPKF